MQNVRYFVLATLAENGPLHGHRLRKLAADDPTGLACDLQGGALYGALSRLARERLISPVRTERERGYPERVLYCLTETGRTALAVLHTELAANVVVTGDGFDLTLVRAGSGSVSELSEAIEHRLAKLRLLHRSAVHRLVAGADSLTAAEEAVVEHTVGRMEAEITWHERLLPRVPAIVGERRW